LPTRLFSQPSFPRSPPVTLPFLTRFDPFHGSAWFLSTLEGHGFRTPRPFLPHFDSGVAPLRRFFRPSRAPLWSFFSFASGINAYPFWMITPRNSVSDPPTRVFPRKNHQLPPDIVPFEFLPKVLCLLAPLCFSCLRGTLPLSRTHSFLSAMEGP